jgi:hypothetical protein
VTKFGQELTAPFSVLGSHEGSWVAEDYGALKLRAVFDAGVVKDAFAFRVAEGNVGTSVRQKTNAGGRSEQVED